MVAISRRSFVEKLGLGVGAAILSPIAETLVNEARGQVAERKIATFFLVANGMHYRWNFTPPELQPATDPNLTNPILNGPTAYTWPAMFKALEPYRSRMLLIDGLSNESRVGGDGGHSMRYQALNCVPAGNGMDPEAGTPGGITIDQLIANKIGASTARRSVLFGISSKAVNQYASVFASGRDRPEPHIQSPPMLFGDLFGALATDGSGVRRGALKQRILFDRMRVDIARLGRAFAPTERRKLDLYLAALEDFERRERVLGALSCSPPAAPNATAKAAPEDALESMCAMSSIAVACGITNVAGVALGCGFSHNTMPEMRKLLVGTPWETAKYESGFSGLGHERRELQAPVMDLVWNFAGRLIAQTIQTLAAIKVGDRTLWDNSVFVLSSENGEEHHAKHIRWPVAIIGNAGGKLKADGRFIRFPKKKTAGARSLADLWCTIATACGVPTSDFGKGGNEPVQGPLDLLLS